jgi:site-specific recombinase XerC
MVDEFEYQGYWWLPDGCEEKVPGILKFDPDDGASLDVLGSLKGLEGTVDPLEPKIFLGLSSEGKHVTLKGCGKTRGTLRFGGGFSTSTFAVSTVFVGEHLGDNEDLVFSTRSGTPIRPQNQVRRSFKPLLRRAGLLEGTRFHDLRHTCATLLFA